MKIIKLILGFVVIGALVALTYFVFEAILQKAIHLVWYDWLDTDERRLLLVPLTVLITIAYFAMQHRFDRASEAKETHGLSMLDSKQLTVKRFGGILAIGFFSLFAGASLGPEAVLVPACLLLGGIVAKNMGGDDPTLHKASSATAFAALFTAFFHSFLIGVLSTLIVIKVAKVKSSLRLWVITAIASLAAYATLFALNPAPFLRTPHSELRITASHIPLLIFVFAGSWASVFALRGANALVAYLRSRQKRLPWIGQAIVASFGLSIIYLIGGPLIQFTGNEAIMPMFEQSASLGYVGLALLVVSKLLAIAWSKTMGYRGGLVFPIIFVISVLVAMMMLINPTLSFSLGLAVGIAGSLMAEARAKVLF